MRHGDAALAEGRYPKALSAYAHAHELAPTDARVQRAQMRGRVYLMATHPARVAQEALEDLAYEANLLRDIEPNLESVCLTALGQILARRNNIEGAKGKFQEAMKFDPQSPLPHIALGMVSLNEPGGLASAKIEFELALQRKPDAIGALVGLGQIKLVNGDLTGPSITSKRQHNVKTIYPYILRWARPACARQTPMRPKELNVAD